VWLLLALFRQTLRALAAATIIERVLETIANSRTSGRLA